MALQCVRQSDFLPLYTYLSTGNVDNAAAPSALPGHDVALTPVDVSGRASTVPVDADCRAGAGVGVDVIVAVALPTPLARTFDYLWPATPTADVEASIGPVPGLRVAVPFGRRRLTGVVVSIGGSGEVARAKLRRVSRILDVDPVLPDELLRLLVWAAGYYHHPIGEVLGSALPVALRNGGAAALAEHERYSLATDVDDALAGLGRAPVQRALVRRLAEEVEGASAPDGVDASALAGISPRWRASLAPLVERGTVRTHRTTVKPASSPVETGPPLSEEQARAVAALGAAAGRFHAFLLNGVTGSGKTEVYLRAIADVLGRGGQVLVLVPEIALTPQLMSRFARRLPGCLVALHSGLSDAERLQSWLLAAHGEADVVVGTRSAVLVPMPRLALVVVDEEHDSSLKQHEGFRYHARDLALMRARDVAAPVVLGSATPSFESLANVAAGRFEELPLTVRAGGAAAPALALLDIRRRPLREGMSEALLDAIAAHLADGGQALVFINRRGFAPTLLCNDCGAAADCARCDAHMTVHAASGRLRCHHCGAERAMPTGCEACGSIELDRVGHGTERIAAALAEAFPDVEIARIDRDSTRRKGALEEVLERAVSGQARLLVGTQMLAKGHHFPALTLVGVLDADRGLYGTDFRALEHMGQLILQVAGRAGRESRPGTVLVQTRNPDNEMLRTLVNEGYEAFAKAALHDRRLAAWPPYSHVALVRCDAPEAERPLAFLERVADFLMHDLANRAAEAGGTGTGSPAPEAAVELLGPAPAPMERVNGRWRARLLLQCGERAPLNRTLGRLASVIDRLPGARNVRWSIDVDPADLY